MKYRILYNEPLLNFFFFNFRDRVRVAEGERESLKQAPCSPWNLTWGLILWPWDHNLSWNQKSDTHSTQPPRRPRSRDFLMEKILPRATEGTWRKLNVFYLVQLLIRWNFYMCYFNVFMCLIILFLYFSTASFFYVE